MFVYIKDKIINCENIDVIRSRDGCIQFIFKDRTIKEVVYSNDKQALKEGIKDIYKQLKGVK